MATFVNSIRTPANAQPRVANTTSLFQNQTLSQVSEVQILFGQKHRMTLKIMDQTPQLDHPLFATPLPPNNKKITSICL